MKKYTFKPIIKLLIISCIILIASSCKKTDEQPAESARIFKPSDIKIVASETKAKLTWTAPLLSTGKALKYSIDFSTDSTFATIKYSATTDTTGFLITEDILGVRIKYYARVKAIATETQPESKYLRSSAFQITGLQYFLPVRELEIKETLVTLRFKPTTGLTSIVLTPTTGANITVPLSTADASAGIKVISGLSPNTSYNAELYIGAGSVGYTNFKTLQVTNYTIIVNNSTELINAINSATDGAVIGLATGTYNLGNANTILTKKSITLKSTSGNPTDTKINYKQFDIKGDGAGISFSGLELDGTLYSSQYFINLVGETADASAATFTNIVLDNCIAHNSSMTYLRGDRAAAKDHKMNNMTINNSIVYDMGNNGTSTYYMFSINKLQFNTINITKSTLYNCGPGLVLASTIATGDQTPVITINYTTINGFGGAGRYALLDANENPVVFTFTNNILANTPKMAGNTVVAAALRSTGTGGSSSISNSNYFNLLTALPTGTALTFGTANLTANQAIDLGWTASTTDFTLPANSPLRTASNSATPIGDPRWTY